MPELPLTFRYRKLPWLLLSAMTLVGFAGPFVIVAVLQGGQRPDWPADRPVEWAVFAGVCLAAVGLMVASVVVVLLNQRALSRPRKPERAGREGGHA